jgi:hypothetical protein
VLRDASCSGFERLPGVRRTAHADIGQIRFTGYPCRRIIHAGAADALQGDVTHALKQMEPSYEATLGYGFTGVLPGVILADALASADRNEEALTLVTGLLEKSSTPERGPFISELWRIRGEMALRQSAANSQEAGRFFGTALRFADEQGANVFRLSAGIPLARMLAEGADERRRSRFSIM